MKYIISIALILIVFFSNAQENETENNTETTNYNNEVGFSFPYLFTGTFRMGIEHYFANKSSLVLHVSATVIEDDYQETIGVSAELQYRFYSFPIEKSFNIYAGPYLMYKYIEENNFGYDYYNYEYKNENSILYNIPGLGVISGVKFVVAKKITFDLSFGGGVRIAEISGSGYSNNSRDGIFSDSYSGIAPKVNLAVGLKF